MAVFESCSVLLELKNLLFKEKEKLKSAITDNGGRICFVVNKQCSLIVTSDVSNLSTNRLRSIHKYQTPVVGVGYVYSCLERGALLPVDDYKLDTSPPSAFSSLLPWFSAGQDSLSHQVSKVPLSKAFGQAKPQDSPSLTQKTETPERSRNVLEKFRIYNENDSDLPTYPDNFQVAKYSIFEKTPNKAWYVLELQSCRGERERLYRVVRHWKSIIGAKQNMAVRDMLVFLSSSEEALEVYKALRENLLGTGLQLRSDILPLCWDLGSVPLRQLLLEQKLNTGSISQEVGVFVELLWTEALGCLSNILRVSVDKLSLNDVSRVEGLLLQARRKLRENNDTEVVSLLDEVYTLLPLRACLPPSAKLISDMLDLCQLIRDVLNVSEMTLRDSMPSCVGRYRALRCSIEAVAPSSSEFQDVAALVQDSKVQIQCVLRVCRGVELQTFTSDLGNIKPLLHSSNPRNFVGVLSRGLLLPRVGVEHHGIERTDIGNLGSGIYFSDAVNTSLKYSKPSVTDGSRLLLVCDVALGRCKDLHRRAVTLTQAPEGHHSVHGVRRTPSTHSEFEDDEYVVYSPDQVKLKYVVKFSIEGDQLKEFSPYIITTAEPCRPSSEQELGSEENGVEMFKNSLDDVKAGLLDSSGQQLPLQAVHVKCKLKDLLSQVVIFQKYTNLRSVPIEAKYVFPLSDSAAVCAFEAFINGKHVVGQVKEKETARKEYKQAIEKGHGAYLMDQDAPDVFTISVGNLPPGATVLIKVTFLSELIVRDGSIVFSLPGRVAPWLESAAINQTTQVTVEKVRVTASANRREFTLDASVEMPYEISSLKCITHKIKIKRTDCMAVVSVLPGQALGPDGFQLSVTLSEVHLPRMWVEKHPVKDSQACMLVFYPKFDVSASSASNEVVLLLDTSESMRGESLRLAQRIALQLLKTLDHNLRLNVVLFGTDHTEAFLTAQPLVEAHQAAESFIKHLSPVGGSTELWRPLRALSLLPPSQGVRNLLLLSDGHIQSAELTLRLVRDNTQHSRLFTCGLSTTANQHMLRTLAQVGGGAFEFFDTKTKHNWAEKVACQVKRMASPCCSSVSVKWQQFSPTAPPPLQAPKQLHGLFNDCHTLVYGFVPHCIQATLLGNLGGQELKTMVSTSELLKTRGTFLHRFTAKALIGDYEDGCLDINEAEHEGKKAELKQFIIEMSKEFSVLSQFTSFVAVEERDSEEAEGFTDIPNLVLEEDVDFLPYVRWIEHDGEEDEEESLSDSSDETVTGICKDEESRWRTEEVYMENCWQAVKREARGSRHYETMADDILVQRASVSLDYSSESVSDSPEEEMDLSDSAELSISSTKRNWGKNVALALVPICGAFDSVCRPPPRDLIPDSIGPPPPQPLKSLYTQGLATALPPPPPPADGFIPTSFLPPPPPPPQPLIFPFTQGLATALPPPPTSFLPPPPPPQPLIFPYSQGLATRLHQPFQQPFFSRPAPLSGVPVPPLPPSSVLRPSDVFDPPPAAFGRAYMTPGASFGVIMSAVEQGSSRDVGRQASQETRGDVVLRAEREIKSPFPLRGGGEPCLTRQASSAHMPIAPQVWSGGSTTFSYGSSVAPQQPQQFVVCGSSSRKARTESVETSKAPSPRKKKWAAEVYEGITSTQRKRVPSRGEPFGLSWSWRSGRIKSPREEHLIQRSDREGGKLRWTKLFHMQHPEGYWELTTELGHFLNVDVDVFADVFLKCKGICSLGVRAHADILRLVATLLVLQLMRMEKLEEGKLLRTLFCLDDPSQPRPEWWEEVKKAVDWVCWADWQYPCIYSRLEFGLNWESSTRQLLGFEGLPPLSPLSGLNLQRTNPSLLVH